MGESKDEIKQFLDSRYVSASEAVWRLFHYQMHEEKPNVVCLPVHSEQGQFVTFDAEAPPQQILAAAQAKDSKLIAYFKANKAEKEYAEAHPNNGVTLARSLLYQDFPTKWVWEAKPRKWKLCQRGSPAIGCMYYVHLKGGDRFYI